MDATSICWMTATFRTSACLRPPALWVRLLLRPLPPSPARACPLPVRTARHPTGIPAPTLAQSSELSESSSLNTAAPDIFSLLSVHMAVSSCSRIQPPACFGWTPLSAPGCWYMPRSAHISQPVSLECLCLRPGHSGATMMFCHPWDAAARILLDFIRPLLASATLTAPLPHVTRRAILSL